MMHDFNDLAAAPKLVITEYLPTPDLVNLAQTSRAHSELFKPMLDVRKFLHYVACGEHLAVQVMLEKDRSLIFKRGVVKDCSGREFENISGFEYALWALDKHMWTLMIECIPSDAEGRKVFKQLLAQYNKVNTDRVTYRLNGKTTTEQHFDFENTIINELQTQLDSINAPGDKDLGAINKQWIIGVGGAQKQLPMHIVHEYCSNEPFYPVPQFTSQPKSSKQFYNSANEREENWFSADSKLSVDFAIYKDAFPSWSPPAKLRGVSCAAVKLVLIWSAPGLLRDLEAMTALFKVRTNDFIDLKSQLEGKMTPDNHHQVSHISPN